MDLKDSMMGFKVSATEREKINRIARDRKMNVSELILTSIDLYGLLDPWFIERLNHMEQELKIHKILILQNLCISRMGQIEAEIEAKGGVHLSDFIFWSGRAVTGKELFDQVKGRELARLGGRMIEKKKGTRGRGRKNE